MVLDRKGMNMKEKKNWLYILLGVIICILLGGLILLYVKYEQLEDRYDDDYHYNTNYDNNSNNNIVDDNDSDNNNQENTNYISRDKALQIALDNLKIKQENVYDLDIELEYKNRYGKMVYEVSFDYNHYEYEYYIDATSGKILDSFVERA